MDTLRTMRPPVHALAILVVLGCFLKLSAANTLAPNWDEPGKKIMEYNKPLVLQCNVTGGAKFTIRWLKEDKPVVADGSTIKILPEENKLVISKATDEHAGANYSCQAVNAQNSTDNLPSQTFQVISLPVIVMPTDTPVVEGETLRLHCNVKAYPEPLIIWTVDGKVVNDSRITFESNGAILVIKEVQMSDRNSYKCTASNKATQIRAQQQPDKDNTGTTVTSFVRVKDKLAALWPFLGICAEVAILCTIILIYEKKRNKAELDESDTDQSPEQKNTPDHGKDVRQRK